MSAIESSLDGITVEFGDELSESDEECNRSEIEYQCRGGQRSDSKTSCEAVVHSTTDSVSSPSIVNTRLDCGPNACPTGCASTKWVLGVRHLSFASHSLNERMAERGKQFSHSNYTSNAKDLRPKSLGQTNPLPKRDPTVITSATANNHIYSKPNVKPMDAIREDSLETHEQYRCHQTTGNIIYKKNGFNVMKEKMEFGRSDDRHIAQTAVEVNHNSSKAAKSETKCTLQLNALRGKDGLNGDHRSIKLNQNVSVSCKPIPKIDYNYDDNNCGSGKRTQNCDKKLKDCDKQKKSVNNNINSINCEPKDKNKLW